MREAFSAAIVGDAVGAGRGWLLASLLCALKNSKANNLNYSPASPGVADGAFVYLNPNVKAKIGFVCRGTGCTDTGEGGSPREGKQGQLHFLPKLTLDADSFNTSLALSPLGSHIF